MRSRTLRRRKFLQLGATAAAAGPTLSCSKTKSRWRYLTEEEAGTLEAICEQIIPSDQDPGARWACVVRFLDRQLAGFYKPLRETYRSGMAEVDRTSGDLFHSRFVDLTGAQQQAVLESIEKGPSKPFFDMLVAHTMQGFYGDPRHGGNREFASWRMLGIPNPPIRGRAVPTKG